MTRIKDGNFIMYHQSSNSQDDVTLLKLYASNNIISKLIKQGSTSCMDLFFHSGSQIFFFLNVFQSCHQP